GGRRAGASTWPARYALEVVRVARREKPGVLSGGPHGEFVAVGLAQDAGARSYQPLPRGRIIRGNVILQDSGGTRGANPAGHDHVLYRSRHPRQRRQRLARRNQTVNPARLLQGPFGTESKVSAYVRVLRGDALEVPAGQLLSRHF